jgi:hypothetical protein
MMDGNGLDERFHGKFFADYMGSAEFEWGSIPACMKSITAHIDDYNKIYTNGKFFWIGPEKAGIASYGDFINKMQDHSLRLKEYVFASREDERELRRYGKLDVMRSELGMDIENCVLFSESENIIKIAQKALRFNSENPLNIRVYRSCDGDRRRGDYFHEKMVTDAFLEREYAGENIEIEKLNDSGEWVPIKNLSIKEPQKTMKAVVLNICGKMEEYFGDIRELAKMKEFAVSIRNKFKRFQIFELKDGNWVEVYDWKR